LARINAPRPTRRGIGLAIAAVVVFVVGSNVQAGWLFVLGASTLGAAMAGIVLPPLVLRRLGVERSAPPVATAGDPVRVRLTLSGRARGAVLYGADGFLSETRFFAERVPATFDYEVVAHRRGIYQGGPVTVSSGFPFGTGVASRHIWASTPITVQPRRVELASFPLLEAVSIPGEPIHDRRRRGGGVDFYGIREYRSGDSLRHVHWRSVARTGKLLVREYEDEPASRLGVFLDAAERVGDEPETAFEDAVACAASLASYALKVGHPVQLFSGSTDGGKHLFEPRADEALDWLAGVEAEGGPGLPLIAERFAGDIFARSTNVLIFPSTRRNATALDAIAHLQSLNTRVVAVLLSAHSYAPGGSSMTMEEEDRLAEEILAARAILYRTRRGADLVQSLREPCLV
jgi:uncharacterized protein (DUF58 family)